MKKIIISFLSIYFLTNIAFSQSGWQQQFYGLNQGVNSIYFIDQNTGWAAFYGTNGFVSTGHIKRTSDGGMNWTPGLGGNVAFQDIKYINNQTGWAIGNASIDVGIVSRNIYKSTNSGINYTLQYADSLQSYFLKLSVIDVNTVVCLKNYGDILRTTNGGLNWGIANLGIVYFDLQFINNTGWILGAFNRIYKSSNNGNNWTLVSQLSANYPNSLHFINESTGFIADENLHKTTNGGINWHVISPIGITAKDISFVNEMRGWATGVNGTIRSTTNGGLNWLTQNTPVSYSTITINCIQFLDQNNGWCSGSGTVIYPDYIGLILKTTNGGVTGFSPISSETPSQFSLSQNYPNPFNPSTKIKFQIPASVGQRHAFDTKLFIYDILGREITTLVNQQLQPGTYEVDWDASGYPSGLYFYKLISADFTETKKMVLIK